MEEKKKHPFLPSNYVTLAQLQERWLKEKERKEKEKELQEKQEQQRRLRQENLQQIQQERDQNQRRTRRTTQTQRRGVDFRSGNRNQSKKKFRPKILNESETNRSAIKVSSEVHEKLEKAEMLGDDVEDKDSQNNRPKKTKKVKGKTRAKILNESETNRSAMKVSSEVHEKLEEKAEMLGDDVEDKDSKSNRPKKTKKVKGKTRAKILNESETNRSATKVSSEVHEKLEEKAEMLGDDVEDKDSKSNRPKKTKKVRGKTRAKKKKDMEKDKVENGTTEGTVEAAMEGEVEDFEVKRCNEQTAINNELNHDVEVIVEDKFRDLSMRCESDKQNSRFYRPYSGVRRTHRNYNNGGSQNCGGYRFRFDRREVPRPRGDKMVWARKYVVTSGGNVAGIETVSGSC